jgi:hypothetical protein
VKLTARETADIIRRRQAKGRNRLSGPKVVRLPSPKADRGRVRDPGFLAYLRRLSCVACWAEGIPSGAPIEAAHIRFSDAKLGRVNPGMQCKPSDRWATPLCRYHHQHDQHKRQERAFWADLGVEPGGLSMALYAAYLAGADGFAVIDAFIPEPEDVW